MRDPKISIITVCYNAGRTIERSIRSVLAQSYQNLEFIVIDGNSTDNTLEIIHKYRDRITFFLTEPDKGIYDAMNKGINIATGDIVGVLNADDFFSDTNILNLVAKAFESQAIEILYGDLDFTNSSGKIVRKWRSGNYAKGSFNFGWMPPHPTFYSRRELFENYGGYRLDLGTCADYELMLRFIHKHQFNLFYLPKVIVTMQLGGASNRNPVSRVKAFLNDIGALKANGIAFPFLVAVMKRTRKIGQYLRK